MQAQLWSVNTVLLLDQTVLMGLSGLLDHTRVIHELLCHPDTDIIAQVGVFENGVGLTSRCGVACIEVVHGQACT